MKHRMKRWTIDASDVLPDHLKHYQKDMGPPESTNFRHKVMYITALDMVKMGDNNPEAFHCDERIHRAKDRGICFE